MNDSLRLERRALTSNPKATQLAGKDPFQVVARLDFQESWIHATLTHIYMVRSFVLLRKYLSDVLV